MGRKRKARVTLPAHIHAVKARGREYYYYHPFRGTKQAGERLALPGAPINVDGTPNDDWWAAYRILVNGTENGPRAGTFAALILAYRASPEWVTLGKRTKVEWSRHLARIEAAWGKLAVRGLEPRHVLELRDAYAETPATANNILRTLSSMMSWCVPRGWRDNNPCTYVKKLKGSIGYAPWSWAEIEHFRRHARSDLWRAAALALYTGQRQADVLDMRWSDVKEGLIAVVQSKTGKKLWIPMHTQLRIVLADMPQDSVYMLTNTKHLPWTVDGFKTSWGHELKRSAMDVVRENRRVFHGLRKSAVVFLLEAGCTDAEVSSITGQSRQMVEHYARQVNQKKLAASAVLKWETADAVRTKNGNDCNL